MDAQRPPVDLLQQGQRLASGSRTVHGRVPIKDANAQDQFGVHQPLSPPTATASRPLREGQTARAMLPLTAQLAEKNASVVSNLLEIHYLDQLMLPMPPTARRLQSVRQRRNGRVLKWCSITSQMPKLSKLEHYDQFYQRVQKYTMEWETPAVRIVPATGHYALALNDEHSRRICRMLEREKDAMGSLSKALRWFANVWIGLVVLVNVIAIGVMVVGAPLCGLAWLAWLKTIALSM